MHTGKAFGFVICLSKLAPKPEVKVVVFRCADRYHTAIPLEDAMREDTLLAYEMNGVPLPTEHGFPHPTAESRSLRHEKPEMDREHPLGKST